MKLSRRQFLKSTLAASALVGAGGMGTLLTPRTAHAIATSPLLTKWIQPIRGWQSGHNKGRDKAGERFRELVQAYL